VRWTKKQMTSHGFLKEQPSRHTLRLDEAGDFARALDGESLVRNGVGPSQDAIALAVDYRRAPEHLGRLPQPQPPPYDASVLIHDGVDITRISLRDIGVGRRPLIQPLPDGEVLLVAPRRLVDSLVENAVVFGSDGRFRRAFTLGDGIEDVQTTTDGRICVAYFDEGIYGNDDWRGEAGLSPAQAGVACFDSYGKPAWTYESRSEPGTPLECSALNVADNAIWGFEYRPGKESLLVQIDLEGVVVAEWSIVTARITALAVSEAHVLLYDHRGRIAVCSLGPTLAEAASLRLVTAAGELRSGQRRTSGTADQVIGRGPFLHAFAGTGWYRFDARTL
jgi:hypothetical protein